MCDAHSRSDEYLTLRDELLHGKNFVIERPLLIITVSVALLNFVDQPYVSFLPPLAIGLLLFNLWFTVDRTRSGARIVAYMQLQLEEEYYLPWLGWETSLREYRLQRESFEPDNTSGTRSISWKNVFDVGGYYGSIYLMHTVIVAIAFAGMIACVCTNQDVLSFALFAIATGFFVWFVVYAAGCHPTKLKTRIEDERIIWTTVFDNLAEKREDSEST